MTWSKFFFIFLSYAHAKTLRALAPTQKLQITWLGIFLETQWFIVSMFMTKKNACRWFSTAIIFGVNRKLTPSTNRHAHANFWKNPNTLGKIGFIKVFYKKWTELYILKIRILHLWLHFLQIIFVIFQNFCWSITWAGIRSTPLFQAIFFCSLWSPWIWILVKRSLWYLSTLKWTKTLFLGQNWTPA